MTIGKFSGSHHLQNMIMQLRKASNHPYLFDWPVIPGTDTYLVDSSIVNVSGKMLILQRLLPVLFSDNHKVLLFSQFTTMLDIIEDWATQLCGWNCCRIDGGVSQDDRQKQIKLFNTDKDTKLFLLSTRAGGLGINLTAADTVIIFDSDWNPQQDLQAQDRAHRIGQTKVFQSKVAANEKPVIVYRLVSANTVETQILAKAASKRKLEKLVIQKGKFKSLVAAAASGDSVAELTDLLTRDDAQQIIVKGGDQIFTDEELKALLDRSEGAYEKAESGGKGSRFEIVEEKGQDDAFATRV